MIAISISAQLTVSELPLAYSYDILNYNLIKTPELREHITKFGISFYKK